MPSVPVAKPIVLCNDVFSDPASRNVHLIGVFDSIRPSEPYPHLHPEFCVFLQLSDAVGTVTAVVNIVEAASEDILFQTAKFSLKFAHRLGVMRALFRIRNCSFPEPGVYWIEVFCNDRFLVDCRLQLH
jgi:hypothetical protein